MKLSTQLIIWLIAISFYSIIAGCQESDSDRAFGSNYIYMPQATSSGKHSIVYMVPNEDTGSYKNFKVDTINNRVDIMLGVSCSGTQVTSEYKVDILTDSDTISAAISSGLFEQELSLTKRVVLLPENCYLLPESVTVGMEESMASFPLSVGFECLNLYRTRILALAVFISNPSKFEINPQLSKTIVLIDVAKLNLSEL